jgi:hypothetical protein
MPLIYKNRRVFILTGVINGIFDEKALNTDNQHIVIKAQPRQGMVVESLPRLHSG